MPLAGHPGFRPAFPLFPLENTLSLAQLQASRDPLSGQIYVPPRTLVADGSLREPQRLAVPAAGVLFSATTFNGQVYGIVDLDCGARIQTLLAPGTDRIGARVAMPATEDTAQARFSHE